MIPDLLFRNRLAAFVVLAVPVCLIVAALGATRFFRVAELNGFDRLVSAGGEPSRAEKVAFVDISDETVLKVGMWPVPRGLVARAIRRLAEGGPELIGLDMLLAVPREPEGDNAMAEALAEAGNVVIPSLRDEAGAPTEPLPKFREAAFDVAVVNLLPDEDGAIRRAPLALTASGQQRMGFATLLASNFLGRPLRKTERGGYSLGSAPLRVSGAPGDVPSVLIGRWSVPSVRVDMLKLLDPAFDPSVFKGKVVVFGHSGKAAKDNFETPLYARCGLVSGPEIHVAAVASLLEGRTTAVVGRLGLLCVNLALALVALGLIVRGRPARSVPLVVLLGVAVFAAAVHLLTRHDIWLPWVSGELTLLLSLPAGLGYRYLREERLLRDLQRP